MGRLLQLAATTVFIASVVAQFPPTPEGLTKLVSKYNPDISISYKEVAITKFGYRVIY